MIETDLVSIDLMKESISARYDFLGIFGPSSITKNFLVTAKSFSLLLIVLNKILKGFNEVLEEPEAVPFPRGEFEWDSVGLGIMTLINKSS